MPTGPTNPLDPLNDSPPRASHPRTALHLAILLLVCIATFWIGLNATSFAASEGHRVVPGWTMLNTGEAFHIEMFGLTYFRKPPGMPWAIAATSAILGHTEFGARAASALASTLAALLAYFFARRWFGAGPALGAGLAQALTPLFWGPGRTAEIEALNNLGTQMACLGIIAIGMRAGAGPESSRERWLRSVGTLLITSLGIIIAALAKGPASIPCVIAAIIVPCVVLRSIKPLLRAKLWLSLAAAAVVLVPLGNAIIKANSAPDAVRQGVSDFLWSIDRAPSVLALLPVAFAAALPTSLVLFIPFFGGRSEGAVRSESGAHDASARMAAVARALALAWVVSLVIFTIAGVSNPRYAMPASAAFLAPLVAYFVVVLGDVGAAVKRESLWRGLALGRPWRWAVVMIVASIVYQVISTRQKPELDSRKLGEAIARATGPGNTIWADGVIEARPDVLLYATRTFASDAMPVQVRWSKRWIGAGEIPRYKDTPRIDDFVLLRADSRLDESKAYLQRPEPAMEVVGQFELGAYRFHLLRVKTPK